MKVSLTSIACFLVILFGLSCAANSQSSDSCSSNVNFNGKVLFDTSSLSCYPVWNAEGYVLRYAQAGPSLWSFVLSAPDTNSWVGMGFSLDGNMIRSSAVVGWVDSNGPMIKRYYLAAQAPNQVYPDQGNLTLLENTSAIISQSSRIYLAFQLNVSQPDNKLIYAVGPQGTLPVSPGYLLSQHRDMTSTTMDYTSGKISTVKAPYSNLRKTHGILNMIGWGILVPIGAMVARYMRHMDPVWFYSHVSVQFLGFIIGLSGVISGLVLRHRLHVEVNKHRGLGIFILVLGILQVLAILARPDKASKVRKYWNWYHWTMGRILILLAAINIFYGIHLGKAGSSWNVGYGVAIAVLAIVSGALEVKMFLRK